MPTILSIIFVGGTLIVSLLQWLFPVSHATAESSVLERTIPSNTTDGAQVGSAVETLSMSTTAQHSQYSVQEFGLKLGKQNTRVIRNHFAAPSRKVLLRDETIAEIQRCLVDEDIRGILLLGRRGCGKSLIARKIAEDCTVESGPLGKRFTHIVWLTFRKEELTNTGIEKPYNYHQNKYEIYAEILKVNGQRYRGNKDPLKGVQEVLRNSRTLVILDSFEFFLEEETKGGLLHFVRMSLGKKQKAKLDRDIAALLKEVDVGSFFLLTSWRDSETIRDYAYRVIEVKPFDPKTAKEYFLEHCSLPSVQLDEGIHEEIFKATAGIPLALDLVGNYLHSINDINAALADIHPRKHYLWEYIYEKSLQQLQDDEKRLLVIMILFKSPLDTKRLREATATRFDIERFRSTLTSLRHRGLFDVDTLYLHDTLREYIMKHVENSALMAEMQKDFIEWAIGIAKANAKWEVDSKQADMLANDLNNLIAALEILISGDTFAKYVKYTKIGERSRESFYKLFPFFAAFNQGSARQVFEESTLCFFGTTIAHYLHINGRWTESEKFLQALLSKVTEDTCKIRVQVLLGRHYAHQEDIQMAENYLRPAMRMAESSGDKVLQAEVFLRLGQTFHRSEPELALEYLKNARDKAANGDENDNLREYDKLRTRISALSYMAEIQLQNFKGDAALELLEDADKDLTKLGWDRVKAHHARLKADAYLLIGNQAMARRFYNESISLSQNGADGRLLAWNYLGLAELDRNLEYARKAKELFEAVGLKSQMERAQSIIDELESA